MGRKGLSAFQRRFQRVRFAADLEADCVGESRFSRDEIARMKQPISHLISLVFLTA